MKLYEKNILKKELEEVIYKILYFNLSTNHENKINESVRVWHVVIDKYSIKESVIEIVNFFNKIHKNSLNSDEMFDVIFNELEIVNDYISEKTIINATNEIYYYIDDNIDKLLKRYDLYKNIKKYNLS